MTWIKRRRSRHWPIRCSHSAEHWSPASTPTSSREASTICGPRTASRSYGWRRDGATTAELAEHLGVTKQAASQIVDELVTKGYVEPQSASDRRARPLGRADRARLGLHARRGRGGGDGRTAVDRCRSAPAASRHSAPTWPGSHRSVGSARAGNAEPGRRRLAQDGSLAKPNTSGYADCAAGAPTMTESPITAEPPPPPYPSCAVRLGDLSTALRIREAATAPLSRLARPCDNLDHRRRVRRRHVPGRATAPVMPGRPRAPPRWRSRLPPRWRSATARR